MSKVAELKKALKAAREEHAASLNPRGQELQLRDRVTRLKLALALAEAEEAKPMKEGEMSERKKRALAKGGNDGRRG